MLTHTDTSFILDYRSQTSPIPELISLSQFLAASLTFIGLQTIELWLDDWKILTLIKKTAPGTIVPIPESVNTKTPEGLMHVVSVQREMVQIDAKWLKAVAWKPSQTLLAWPNPNSKGADSLRGFFSRLTGVASNNSSSSRFGRDTQSREVTDPDDLTSEETATAFLHITTADIRPSVTDSFAKELERATKKPPPRTTSVAMLTSPYDNLTLASAQNSVDIFASVLPKRSGRIFIGFPTAQTTGFLAHLSAPSVIPTVEREAIDLNARHVSVWNREILCAAGILCRIAWTCEMQAMSTKLLTDVSNGASIDAAAITLIPQAIHTFKQFTYQESTPSSQVGQLLEGGFWSSGKEAAIDLFSSKGVYVNQNVRLPSPEVNGFVHNIPILPQALSDGAKEFVAVLKEYDLVKEISITDIFHELEGKTLDVAQLRAFLAWCAKKKQQGTLSANVLRDMLDVAIVSLEDGLLATKGIRFFITPSRIPADLPHPLDTIPFSCTKTLSKDELEQLGWEELQLPHWLSYIVEQAGRKGTLPVSQDITLSASFSGIVLPVVSKSWEMLDPPSRVTIINLLRNRTIIPTKMGMKRPTEAYFANVRLFQDLPIVSGLNNVKEKFLVALGVRKTIELSLIFDRLLAWKEETADPSTAQSGKWSHVELIRYLASVANDIPAEDINRLKRTAICPAEDEDDRSRPTAARFRVSQLYEPKDSLRDLHFPVLQWSSLYRPGSQEGRFLTMLGLQASPSALDLITAMAKTSETGDEARHGGLMAYFIKNYHVNSYAQAPGFPPVAEAYMPVEGGNMKRLSAVKDCFLNERAAVFGCSILKKELHIHAQKFGVKSDPPVAYCVRNLMDEPPLNGQLARAKFGYLGVRIGEIGSQTLETLSVSTIVPISANISSGPNSNSTQSRLQAPSFCFIGENSMFHEIFDFVDFGSEANAFLLACGSKHAPSEKEIAALIAQEPARTLGTLQSPEKYLGLLRTLATNKSQLKQDKKLFDTLKRAPCLLASREVLPEPGKEGGLATQRADELLDLDEGPSVKEFILARADQIVQVDDIISYSLFKDRLLVVPEEELLEGLYYSLGSPLLSSLVEEEPYIGILAVDQNAAVKLQKLVYERTRLFLHDYTADLLKHDVQWLEKNLRIHAVKSISLRRSLKAQGLSHVEKRTAAVTYEHHKGWILWITSEYELFQVSQALVNLLLLRPKPHSTMILEMLLGTDLLRLRARGYNVDRILRAKAAEARIAEDHRQKQVEVERQKLQEQERSNSHQSLSENVLRNTSVNQPMPGSFEEPSPQPEDRETTSARRRRPNSFFSTITRRLGIDDSSSGSNSGSGVTPHSSLTRRPSHESSSAMNDSEIESTLSKAVGASRAHGSSKLFSTPSSNMVEASNTYCDARPGHDISYTGHKVAGIKIFLSRSAQSDQSFVNNNWACLEPFGQIIVDCGQIFNLPLESLHIFYDEEGKSVAFNRQGSLFCNLRFFKELHFGSINNPRGPNSGNEVDMAVGERVDTAQCPMSRALIYWFVVFGHELAHNIVSDHSSAHSFWS